MTDNMNKGRGFLKDKMDGYQVPPPDSVWNSISGRIGRSGRRRMLVLVISAAASLALAVTLGIQFFGPGFSWNTSEGEQKDLSVQERAGQSDLAAEPAGRDEFGTSEQDLKEAVIADRKPSLKERVRKVMQEPVIASGALADSPAMGEEYAFHTDQAATGTEDQDGQPVQQDEPMDRNRQEPTDGSSEDRTDQVVKISSEGLPSEGLPSDQLPSDQLPSDELLADEMEELKEGWKNDPRWMVGAALSPLYSFRDAAPEAIAGMPDHESGMVAYAGGVQVGYRTTRRLALETGIFFNKMGVDIGAPGVQAFSKEYDFAPIGAESSRSEIIAVSNSVGNIITKSGEIYVNNYKLNASYDANSIQENVTGVLSDQTIRQHLDYLEVPLNLRYTVIDRNLKIQVVGGLSTNLLVNNYVTMETTEGTSEIGYLSNIRTVNYSGNAGIGFVYYFLDRLSLSMEPRFRYFLHSVNDATLPATRPYTLGLYTGLNFNF
jgi:hypothetical protein